MSLTSRNALHTSSTLALEASRVLQANGGATTLSNITNGLRCSRLTASLSAQGGYNRAAQASCFPTSELAAILQGNTPALPSSFFGVSPPVRACNPFGLTHQHQAASINLNAQRQALRELETAGGASFLRGDLFVGSPPECAGAVPPAPMAVPAAVAPEPLCDAPLQQRGRYDAVQQRASGSGTMSPFSCPVKYYNV